MQMIWTLRAIFGAVVFGDILIAVVICLLLERREWAENAQIRKVLTGFPPDETPDAAKRAKEAREKANEEAIAWSDLMHYSPEEAYGTGGSG
ncbi:MAG: hypothetical protein IJQ81_05505 [Oscillibacter sp.]|nr:hypothetical protein [Oscillibacter sp.]